MGKSLKAFLNQSQSLRQPVAEDHALAALLNGDVVNAPAPLLPAGPFTREDARTVAAYYANVSIENDQFAHFQLAMRDGSG